MVIFIEKVVSVVTVVIVMIVIVVALLWFCFCGYCCNGNINSTVTNK